MANEIRVNLSLSVANGAFRDTFMPGQLSIDQAAIGRGGSVQAIGTSEEVVAFGDVSTSGILVLQNLDATNFVEFGPESSGAMVAVGKLLPGEVALLRMKPAVVLRAKADTNPVKLDVRLYEN